MKNSVKAGFLLVFIPCLATAQVHKWVDEKGVTVYSQTPPSGETQSQVVAPPPPPATDPKAARQELDATLQRIDDAEKAREEDTKATAESQKKSKNEAQVRASCERARANLVELERGPPRKLLIGPDGEAKRLSYEELQAEITDTKQYIEKNCKEF